MGNITEYLNKIKNAVFGKDVRDAIHDSIKQCYKDGAKSGNANMEVSEARGGYNTLNDRLNVEKARVDNLTKLEEGSTTGDAELIDIRTGSDGTSYSSAGESVRNQFNNISNLIINNFSTWYNSNKTNDKLFIRVDFKGNFKKNDIIWLNPFSYSGNYLKSIATLAIKEDNTNDYYQSPNLGDSYIINCKNNYKTIGLIFNLSQQEAGNLAECRLLNLSNNSGLSKLINMILDSNNNLNNYINEQNKKNVFFTPYEENITISSNSTAKIPINLIKGNNYKFSVLNSSDENINVEIYGNSYPSTSYGIIVGNNELYATAYEDSPNVNLWVSNITSESNLTFKIEQTLSIQYLEKELLNLKNTSNIITKFSPYNNNRVLILGDSYSQQGYWIKGLKEVINISSLVNLGVTNATVRDKYADRTQYPYTSRPVSSQNSGNLNTLSCQIEKLKRLMTGTDLDNNESKIYTSEKDYPNIIIIEGGMNDTFDTDDKVSTYYSQFLTKKDNVYFVSAGTTKLGSYYIKSNINNIDRTCFAGAYRYIVEELSHLFPNAQIFFTTASRMGYFTYDVNERRNKTADQQRLCAKLCGASIIDWNAEGNINTIIDYPSGSGTQSDPYKTTTGSLNTSDGMHPNSRGGKLYGRLAGKTIIQKFIDIENM